MFFYCLLFFFFLFQLLYNIPSLFSYLCKCAICRGSLLWKFGTAWIDILYAFFFKVIHFTFHSQHLAQIKVFLSVCFSFLYLHLCVCVCVCHSCFNGGGFYFSLLGSLGYSLPSVMNRVYITVQGESVKNCCLILVCKRKWLNGWTIYKITSHRNNNLTSGKFLFSPLVLQASSLIILRHRLVCFYQHLPEVGLHHHIASLELI